MLVSGMDLQEAGFSLKILVAGERFNATGEYFKRGSTSEKILVIGHQTLAEEFCLVSGEFSDLQCLNEHPEEVDISVVPITFGQRGRHHQLKATNR